MKGTILIVDDDPISRKILKKYFSDFFECVEAKDGKEALDIIFSGVFDIDLMLLDLVMPEYDGFSVMWKLKKEKRNNFPTIVITSTHDLNSQLKAFELGVSDFINKPFDKNVVYERVMSVFNDYKRDIAFPVNKKMKHNFSIGDFPKKYKKEVAIDLINSELEVMGANIGILFLFELEGFDKIRDEYGPLISNHIIKLVSDVIINNYRSSDIVGMIADNKIIVYTKNDISDDNIRKKVDKIMNAISADSIIAAPAKLKINLYTSKADNDTGDYNKLYSSLTIGL